MCVRVHLRLKLRHLRDPSKTVPGQLPSFCILLKIATLRATIPVVDSRSCEAARVCERLHCAPSHTRGLMVLCISTYWRKCKLPNPNMVRSGCVIGTNSAWTYWEEVSTLGLQIFGIQSWVVWYFIQFSQIVCLGHKDRIVNWRPLIHCCAPTVGRSTSLRISIWISYSRVLHTFYIP